MDRRDFVAKDDGEKPEIREEGEGNDKRSFIEGYAIVFNRDSKDLGGFVEVILPKAMDGADVSDIMGRYNHQILLGRSTTGTMTFITDKIGVRYSIRLPNTDYPGNYVREMVEREDINGSSFAFDVKSGGSKWEELKDGGMKRTVSAFSKIYDMGPVDNPAYADSTAGSRKHTEGAVRSLEKFKKSKGDSEVSKRKSIDRQAELRKLELIELELLEND